MTKGLNVKPVAPPPLGLGIRKTDPQYLEVMSRGKLWPMLFKGTAPVLTIDNGRVDLIEPHHRIETEDEADTDNLDEFQGGQDGKVYLIRPASDDHTIVVRHGAVNIFTTGGANLTLDRETDVAFVIFIRELEKYMTWSFGVPGGGIISDHGLLSGLNDDDHPQYLLDSLADNLGDTIYATADNVFGKLAGNVSTTKMHLTQQGDGFNSAAPAWEAIEGGPETTISFGDALPGGITLTPP